MTQYRLNQSLIFDDEIFQLSSLSAPQVKIKLSATASRCLTLFIERQGETIDKDTLMHECWGKFGTLVTEGSMWKNISQLRQAFQKLNVPYEVIVTVPRLGYTFSSQIQVEKVGVAQPLQSEESAIVEIEPVADASSVNNEIEIVTDSGGEAETVEQITPQPPQPLITDREPSVSARAKILPALLTALVVLNMAAAGGFYFYKNHNQQLHDFDVREQYRPTASLGETQVYLQAPLNEQSVYAKEAVNRFNHDKPQTLAGKSVNYLYINKVSSRNLSSYFLCDAPITEKDNGCSAYFSLRNGAEK